MAAALVACSGGTTGSKTIDAPVQATAPPRELPPVCRAGAASELSAFLHALTGHMTILSGAPQPDVEKMASQATGLGASRTGVERAAEARIASNKAVRSATLHSITGIEERLAPHTARGAWTPGARGIALGEELAAELGVDVGSRVALALDRAGSPQADFDVAVLAIIRVPGTEIDAESKWARALFAGEATGGALGLDVRAVHAWLPEDAGAGLTPKPACEGFVAGLLERCVPHAELHAATSSRIALVQARCAGPADDLPPVPPVSRPPAPARPPPCDARTLPASRDMLRALFGDVRVEPTLGPGLSARSVVGALRARGATSVASHAELQADLISSRRATAASLLGLERAQLEGLRAHVADGSLDDVRDRHGVAMGAALARSLGVAPGDAVVLRGRSRTPRGPTAAETGGRGAAVPIAAVLNFDNVLAPELDRIVIVSQKTARALWPEVGASVTRVVAWFDDAAQIPNADDAPELSRELDLALRLTPTTDAAEVRLGERALGVACSATGAFRID